MNCKHCGFELPDTAKFCRSCGKPQGVGIEPVLTAPAAAARAPAAKSIALKSMLISIAIVGSVGGTGYWGWTQKVVSDEKKSVAASLQAAEEKRKADVVAQGMKQEAEAKAKVQAEAEQAKKEQEERDAKEAELAMSEKDRAKKAQEEHEAKQVELAAAKKEQAARSAINVRPSNDKSSQSDSTATLNWTGNYRCSENLLPNAVFKKEFEDKVVFSTTSGNGTFTKRAGEITEKFSISIRGSKVEINSEGSRTNSNGKWSIRTSGTMSGKEIITSGSMYGTDGQQVVRQICKFQLSK